MSRTKHNFSKFTKFSKHYVGHKFSNLKFQKIGGLSDLAKKMLDPLVGCLVLCKGHEEARLDGKVVLCKGCLTCACML